MQLVTFFAFAAAAMMGVEARGIGGRPGKSGGRAGKAAGHAGDAAGVAGDVAGFIPAGGDHARHNCCRNNGPSGGGWIFDDWAKSLTASACKQYNTAQLIDQVCVEASGYPISGDSFFGACRGLVPGDNNVGAGYRGTC